MSRRTWIGSKSPARSKRMKPRERVSRTLNHQEVDRVPIDLGGTQNSTMCAGAYENFKRFLGVETPTRELSRVFETVIMDEAVLSRLPVDTRRFSAAARCQRHPLAGRPHLRGRVGHHLPPRRRRRALLRPGRPSAGRGDVGRPRPLPGAGRRRPSRYAGLADLAHDLHENTDYAVCASTADTTIFDKAWMLAAWRSSSPTCCSTRSSRSRCWKRWPMCSAGGTRRSWLRSARTST